MFIHDILQSFMLGHMSMSRWKRREFSAVSCSFGHAAVVLAMNKILSHFGHFPTLQQKQQFVNFFREVVCNPLQSNLI